MPDPASEEDLGPMTAPQGFVVSARGFRSEDEARDLAIAVRECVLLLSRCYDLSSLDGVTVAHDYPEALASLDRGYATDFVLRPSNGHAVGIAMTPKVLRDGLLKSHIVFNAGVVEPMAKPKGTDFHLALHVIAHECAHVEITQRFDQAFPGVLLQKRFPDPRIAYRWQVITACWEEYAATLFSATMGENPIDGYEETLLKHLQEARPAADLEIHLYREHGNVDRVYGAVYVIYGELMKYSAYFLGTLVGQQRNVAERAELMCILQGHWFEPYFDRLKSALKAIYAGYGRWTEPAVFEAIGDIADEVVSAGGIQYRYLPNGSLFLSIP